MNQIITQHGWCLNANMWLNFKKQFGEDFIWQDNERGYFKGKNKDSKWVENCNKNDNRIVICHSLGTQLINPNVLYTASHAVLINSFFNFIPKNNRKRLVIRKLEKMEAKIKTKEVESLIKEFIKRSFFPNSIDDTLNSILNSEYKNINAMLLLNDFKKLYFTHKEYRFFSKGCKILILRSKNDSILEETAVHDFINLLNRIQINPPKVIYLENQGHLLKEIEIFKIIKEWLNR